MSFIVTMFIALAISSSSNALGLALTFLKYTSFGRYSCEPLCRLLFWLLGYLSNLDSMIRLRKSSDKGADINLIDIKILINILNISSIGEICCNQCHTALDAVSPSVPGDAVSSTARQFLKIISDQKITLKSQFRQKNNHLIIIHITIILQKKVILMF